MSRGWQSFFVARSSVWAAPSVIFTDSAGKLLDPVEAVLIERERLQLHPAQTGLDLPAIHFTAECQLSWRILLKAKVDLPASRDDFAELQATLRLIQLDLIALNGTLP